MRARDVRAIAFCIISLAAVFAGTMLLSHNFLASLGLGVAYGAWLATRPRMIRVFRRLRGEPDWTAYYDNHGGRLRPPGEPGTAPSSPRPIERR
jgi:hypothetical protein